MELPDEPDELYNAVKNGNISEVKKLIAANADVNAVYRVPLLCTLLQIKGIWKW